MFMLTTFKLLAAKHPAMMRPSDDAYGHPNCRITILYNRLCNHPTEFKPRNNHLQMTESGRCKTITGCGQSKRGQITISSQNCVS